MIGITLLLLLFITNQIIQIVSYASNINILLGRTLLVLLIVFFGSIILIPIVGFIKLPSPLVPPDRSDEGAYKKYQKQLIYRLSTNKYLREEGLAVNKKSESMDDIQKAMETLNAKATVIIKESASKTFFTTAISQNGALDGIFVLMTLLHMVWKISHLYNQRPNFKDIWILYVNVGATVIMAREINDLNLLDEQLEPVITSLLGGTIVNIVPGTTMVTNLIVNSIIEGSANAFLTLRVGAIAKGYCSSMEPVNRKKLRYSATLEACSMLGNIIHENSFAITKAFVEATGKAANNTFKYGKTKVEQMVKNKSMFRKKDKATL